MYLLKSLTLSTVETSATKKINIIVNIWQIIILVLLTIYVSWFFISNDESKFFNLYLSDGIYLLGAGLIILRIIVVKKDRIAWAFVAAGIISWVVADILYYSIISKMTPIPTVSIIDWLYIIFYLCMYIAVIRLARSSLKHIPLRLWLDSMVAVFATLAYLSLALPAIYEKNSFTNFNDFIANMGNVIGGLLLVCLLVAIVDVTMWRLDMMWWFIVAGSIILWLTDTVYYLANGITGYSGGDLVDLGWMLGIVLLGLASWRPNVSRLKTPTGISAVYTPLIAIVSSFVLAIYATQSPVPLISIIFVVITVIVGIIRLAQILQKVYGLDKVNNQAFYDGLTGLRNRYFLNTYLELLSKHKGRQTKNVSLILIKIRSLKGFNDAFGVTVGDDVIREVARRLMVATRNEGFLSHFNSGKFGLLIADDNHIREVKELVDSIIVELDIPLEVVTPNSTTHMIMPLEYNIGIATEDKIDSQTLGISQKATNALSAAIEANEKIVYYTSNIDMIDGQTFFLEHMLRSALQEDEIICHYQPKLDLDTNTVYEIEAFARWNKDGETIVAPDVFLPVVKRLGLMPIFTARILDMALSQTKQWRDEGIPIRISVNITVDNLTQIQTATTILETLAKYKLPGNSLMIEITEPELVENMSMLDETVQRLADEGVTFSIGDTSAGRNSTLERLAHLNLKEFKVPRSLTNDVGRNADTISVIKTMIEQAHDLGLVLVAEGVETRQDYEQLHLLGCDTVQGYYICRPAGPAEIKEWLQTKNKNNVRISPKYSLSNKVSDNKILPYH